MRTVTVNLIGVAAPGVPRQLVLAVRDGATVRDLIDEVVRRGGESVGRAIWTDAGGVDRSVLVAVDGEVRDLDRLDAPLGAGDGAAEVSLFLIRPIFGG